MCKFLYVVDVSQQVEDLRVFLLSVCVTILFSHSQSVSGSVIFLCYVWSLTVSSTLTECECAFSGLAAFSISERVGQGVHGLLVRCMLSCHQYLG